MSEKLKQQSKVRLKEIGEFLKFARREQITAAKLMEIGNDLSDIHQILNQQPASVFTSDMDDALIVFKSEAYGLADAAEAIKVNLFDPTFYNQAITLGKKLIAFSSMIHSFVLPVAASVGFECVEKLLENLN